MIAGRRGDETKRALFVAELRGEVHAAAHLERGGRRHALKLERDVRIPALRQARAVHQRRGQRKSLRDDLLGAADIVERWRS